MLSSSLLLSLRVLADTGSESAPQLQTQACRPTFSCTADLVPHGTFEMESGYFSQDFPNGKQTATPTLFKLSVLDSLQLQVGGNGFQTDTTNGGYYGYFDDVLLGLKYQFLKQEGYIPSMAVTGSHSLSTPRRPGYNWDHDSLVYHVSETYHWLHGDFNYGVVFWRGEGYATQTYAALALTAAVGDDVNLVLEGTTFSNAGAASAQNNDLIEAVQYAARPWLTLDFAVTQGFYQGFSTFSVAGGLTYALRLWE